MDRQLTMDALAQVRREGAMLNEILDLSRQLAEAVDRNDQVVIQMLVAMREEPILKLKSAQRALHRLRGGLSEQAEPELIAALDGVGPSALSGQVAANARILQQILDLDKVINQKVSREKSVYS